MSIASFLDTFRKLAPKPLLAVALGSGAILALPDSWADALGLLTARDEWRPWISGALIVSLAYLASHATFALWSLGATHYHAWRHLRNQRKCLHALTPMEKAYLSAYIDDRRNTQYFSIQDGVAEGLRAKGVLYRPSAMGDAISGFAYNLQPWARAYLEKHPERLEGAADDTTEERPATWKPWGRLS